MSSLPSTPRPFLSEDLVSTPKRFLNSKPRIYTRDQYDSMYQESINNPARFWSGEASELTWFKNWDHVNQKRSWFVGGVTNLCYNAIDRHIDAGKGDQTAIIFDTEKDGSQAYTYLDLYKQICRLSNVMTSEFDIHRGDRVLLYLPLCPEAVIAMLACTRIGAIHTVVFGGFKAEQIKVRIDECSPKLVITADGCFRRGSAVPLKSVVDEAIQEVEDIRVLNLNRNTGAAFTLHSGRDFDWLDLLVKAPETHQCARLDSEDPSFILYTSGSTGRPKGIVHGTGGYMVGAYTTLKYVFDMKSEDTYWCTADLGWITGHTYVAYGPLLLGGSQLLYEGGFNYPDWNTLFRLIECHRITTLYTAPTLLRSIMNQNVTLNKFDLSSLRLLGSVGEPINKTTWLWYFNEVGGGNCPVVDTWWQTETGSNILTPIPGAIDMEPGSATVPFFGVDPFLVDDNGRAVPFGEVGYLYIRDSWPSMMIGMWGRTEEEVEKVYFATGHYLTGDIAVQSRTTKYFKILGRADDQLNVSGHRIGSAEVETAVLAHDAVVKAVAIGLDDEITGQCIAACVVLSAEFREQNPHIAYLGLNQDVNKLIGTHINVKIGPHARPKYCYIVENLPETRSGKTMRGLIKDLLVLCRDNKCDPHHLDSIEQKYSTIDKSADTEIIQKLVTCFK